MRIGVLILALSFTALACPPSSAQTARDDCAAATTAPMPPSAGPFMKDMKMREPMPGQMKKDGMMMGDVAKSAAEKEKCMEGVMKFDEKTMDERKNR